MITKASFPASDSPTLFGWPRVRVVLIASLIISLLWMPIFQSSWGLLMLRLVSVGAIQLTAFGILARWPSRLPTWLAHWVLQLIAVALIAPLAAALVYTLTTWADPQPWYQNNLRLTGFGILTGVGVLISPWIAMSALYRQISGQAQRQRLSFELERSEFARDALDSRLRLLQAQVEPHFLFNTLANVRELVDSGSPQASSVLNSLIAYLRAAVPRLNEAGTTLAQELELVRAYLELMHMRMPDRLQFSIDVEDAALSINCPTMSLLTLVENAVRHGIDPSEEGGHIQVQVRLQQGRCYAAVSDTGVGLAYSSAGSEASLGTGLATLRERLQLVYAGDAQLTLTELSPHGVKVEFNFPANRSQA
ncbi:sensor histidine kinase [Undibacterium sp. Ren11W]|uniref:sensor histidine kinase n=1 Tax=Undibacterium sp. Ren11W TaxID=3413045 RepID=UPI003BF37328